MWANAEVELFARNKKFASFALTVNTRNFFSRKGHCTNCLQIRQQLLSDPGFGHIHADLRKAIYSANTELMAISSLFTGNQMFKPTDYAKFHKPLTELISDIQAVEQSTTDADLQKTSDVEFSRTITNVTTKTKAVKKMIQNTKKK